MSLTLIACPECGAPAEVTDEGLVYSTDGPVRMVRVRCLQRHWFLLAEDRLRAPQREPARREPRHRGGSTTGPYTV